MELLTNLGNNFSQSCANNKEINNINNLNNHKEGKNSPKGEFLEKAQKTRLTDYL